LAAGNLTKALLNQADFSGANLARAVLDGAFLEEASLTGANLEEASIQAGIFSILSPPPQIFPDLI
jgi:uncharacterized protein YjbI with pentapeptide repeats